MKVRHMLAGILLAGAVLGGMSSAQAACTATGFIRDGNDLTAAQIAPARVNNQDVDATGCDMGIYYPPGTTGNVHNSNIHGALYYGIAINGANVGISLNRIHDIGDSPFNGNQRGVAIYCAPESAQPVTVRTIQNMVTAYQKGGIVYNSVNCQGVIEDNFVGGMGPISFIAQNGIQVRGTTGVAVSRNSVWGHSYTGDGQASSGGILVLGGDCFGDPLAQKNYVVKNNVDANDVGIYALNISADCVSAPSTPTNNVYDSNTVDYGWVTNTTGNVTGPYQFGLSIDATGDTFKNNIICGRGYDPDRQVSGGMIGAIDTAGSGSLTLTNNGCVGPRRAAPIPPAATTNPDDKTVMSIVHRARTRGAHKPFTVIQ